MMSYLRDSRRRSVKEKRRGGEKNLGNFGRDFFSRQIAAGSSSLSSSSSRYCPASFLEARRSSSILIERIPIRSSSTREERRE